MTPDSGRVSIPSWKLELMKNRRNSRTSASFSHYDRTRRPETLKTPAREDDNAKPRDIINFFNRKTSIDVARVNVCSSRSFRERRGAGDVGTMSCRPGGGMWAGPGGEHCQPVLSCERTDGSVTVNRSPLQTLPDTDNQTDQHTEEEEAEDDLQDMIWAETGSASSEVESDRYSDKGEVEILFGQSMHNMGEDTRLFVSNGGARQDADRQARLASGVGARLYRGRQVNKKNSGRGLNGNGSGDSDGMMGSGGESDSSEEIHYGPGFVSRLKSRYMSVALRGSPRGGLGTLRRTASLEYFLDCDKNCEEEELELQPTHAIVPQTKPAPYSSSSQSKANTKRESMKRAQSVEVLSFQTEKPPVLPSTFFSVDVVSPPPSESPPPLPPRERDSPSVHGVLNTAPALVNDTVIIAEKQPPPIPSSHPKPANQLLAKNASQLPAGPAKTKMRANNSSNAKPSTQKQRSSNGVLFGVKDKELPAQDIVKETRKLFESNNSTGGRRAVTKVTSKAGGLTKSKSTSNLYSKSPSRSSSLEKPKRAGTGQSPRTGYSSSPQRRPSSSPARPKLPSKATNSTPRPALPAKPSHLSPMVNGKTASSLRSAVADRQNVQKVTPTKVVKSKSPGSLLSSQTGSSGLVKASLANVIPSDTPSREQDAKTRDLENKSIQLNLRPIKSENDTEKGANDVGTKRITSTSIQNIRNSGNVVNFVFDDKSGGKSHLPGSSESAKSPPPKQVGVIRPISRDSDGAKQQDFNNHRDLKLKKDELKENKTSPIHVNKNNKVSGSKENNDQRKKETLIIEKDPVFVPVESSRENTQNKNYINKKIHSSGGSEAPQSGAQTVILTSNSVRSPPSVPPRNGSKLEHAEQISQQRKYFDSNIEPLTCSPDPGKSDAKAVTVDQEKSNDVTDKSYRDSWKSRSDQQNNTFVFNFVNSKKDVSHIENDGLDLTKRSKKGGVILLDSNGESCDGDHSEGDELEPVECSNNFVFVGAEIKTGKSSIRSKLSKRKLNISFNDKTEVFEYPSFESVDMDQDADIKEKEDRDNQLSSKPQQSQSIFKNNSSVVGSSGGLGSYTPSKIQISESPFQLGVSRTTSSSSTPSITSSSKPSPSTPSSKSSSNGQETILLPVDEAEAAACKSNMMPVMEKRKSGK